MASGYRVGGIDLDDIFEPRGSSTPRANTGYKVAGVDIAQRYYASTGSDIPPSDTGYRVAGTDIRQLFRRKGYVEIVTPTIDYIGGDTTLYVGQTLSLTCYLLSDGGGSVSYKWYKNGSIISGATGSTYTKSNVGTGDAADYSCIATNEAGDSEPYWLGVSVYSYPSASVSGSSSVASGGGGGGSWSWSVSASAGISQYRVYVPGHGGSWSSGGGATSFSGSISWGSPIGSPDFSSTPGSYEWRAEVIDSNGETADGSCPFSVV
jgi:hypothetical protein